MLSIPAWAVEDVDAALIEGRHEANWNKAASCPKCGIVCARSWTCDFCGNQLVDCSPRLCVAEPKREPSTAEFWESYAARQMKADERLRRDLEHQSLQESDPDT